MMINKKKLSIMAIVSIVIYFLLSIIYQQGTYIDFDNSVLYTLNEKLLVIILTIFGYNKSYNSYCILALGLFGIYELISVIVYILGFIKCTSTLGMAVFLSNPIISISFSIIGAICLLILRQTYLTKKKLRKIK